MPENVLFHITDLVPLPLVQLAVMTPITDTESPGIILVTVASVEVFHYVGREVGVERQTERKSSHFKLLSFISLYLCYLYLFMQIHYVIIYYMIHSNSVAFSNESNTFLFTC